MLTTFNEVNMKPIMDLRKQYGEVLKTSWHPRPGFYVLLRESGGSAR